MGGRLEICIDSYESASNAVKGGADQLEVCSCLALGGLTPSIGLIRRLRASFPQMPLFAMLRPRGGNFIYTDEEVEVMLEDLRAFKAAGVTGFVFGALTSAGELDESVCAVLLRAAKPAPCTLHRAFDLIEDWSGALDSAVKLGFKAILTSGQAANALAGSDRLRKITKAAGDRIHIIAGAGVNSETLPSIMQLTGCFWFHGSASSDVEQKIRSKNGVVMGPLDTNVLRVTSKEKVRSMRDSIDAFFGTQPLLKPYY